MNEKENDMRDTIRNLGYSVPSQEIHILDGNGKLVGKIIKGSELKILVTLPCEAANVLLADASHLRSCLEFRAKLHQAGIKFDQEPSKEEIARSLKKTSEEIDEVISRLEEL